MSFTTQILLDANVIPILRCAHMKHIGVSIYQLVLFALVASAFTIALAALPVRASALEATTQTAQVLPVGGNSCAPVAATNFTPYIYEGALHSFEFTLLDASYTALIGSIGNTSIPFNVMTRSVDASGMLRVHVDINARPIFGTLPLKVTLLSARSGQPVCLTVVSMNVGTGAIATIPNTSITTTPTTPSVVTKPAPTAAPSTTSENSLTTTTVQSSVVSTVQNPLQNVCATDAGAYRLWLILLVLYMLIVGVALWAEFPMSMAWARTPERIATIILVFLLLLLAFWYFSISCRAALWMPLVAFLVAVLGLLAAFWNHPRVTQLLLIQEPPKSSSTTIITPPAKK